MPRTVLTVPIGPEFGRDKDKVFVVTEMSATQAEEWAARALMAMGRSGVQIPQNIAKMGLYGIATLGVQALVSMSFHDAKPLLDEMMDCVQIIPDRSKPTVMRRLVEDDIEEVGTRLRLRQEVLQLITGFSLADVTSNIKATMTTPAGNTSTTRTRRRQSRL